MHLVSSNPIAFFAPEPRYSTKQDEAVTEFKTMVRELHRAGLEVILDVVYNHTAASGFDGPTLSFKGFDNAASVVVVLPPPPDF